MKPKLHRWMWLGCGLMLVLQGCSHHESQAVLGAPVTLASLLAMATNGLARVDIAHVNLVCAHGLSGCETVDVTNSLELLDQWVTRVQSETKRHQYRWERDPAEFEHSKGFFKMLMLGVVLAEDFKVHYRTDRQVSPDTASTNDGFFGDARDVFLPGLLSEQRQGTCSSMPVLYVAAGRRLGYPLKLVTTKGHLFVRWEGEGERFNLEVTGNGLNRFPDDYYLQWPFAVSDVELASERYLQSLSPAGELAVFLSIRAMCLQEAGQMAAASDAFEAAAQLSREVQSYRFMAERCRGSGDGRQLLTRKTGQSK